MRKLFGVLAAILVVGFFVGCGSGGGSNENGGLPINESYDFPPFDIPAIGVKHSIQRTYPSLDELNKFVANFKEMGAYNTTSDGLIVRKNPLGSSGHITQATISTDINNTYIIAMSIDIDGADIVRDDELFKTIFGDTNAPINYVGVDKTFDSDITSELETYGQSLDDDFSLTRSTNLWMKDGGGAYYSFIYSNTLASWIISKKVLP
jgi:hypothetical protein